MSERTVTISEFIDIKYKYSNNELSTRLILMVIHEHAHILNQPTHNNNDYDCHRETDNVQ